MKVGYIGLGTMGLPMARHLIEAGHEVWVVSRSRGPIEKAISWGAKEAESPYDLAGKAEFLFSALPMPDTVEEVFLGENGVIAGGKEGLIIADHSTVSPALNRKIYEKGKEKGISYLDAPVSGGPMGAEAGTLTIMCGGEEEAFRKVKPLLEAMGKLIVRVGEIGSGSVVKLINNLLAGIHTVALSEAFVMGAKAGIDPEVMRRIIKASTGHSYMIDRTLDLIQDRDFAQRFSIRLLHKDIKIALRLAEELGIPLRVGKVSGEYIGKAEEAGYGPLDMAALIRPLEEETGIEVRRREKKDPSSGE
ncbi:MAG: NAD(P)-dependent oxidoreductase [Thermicanus sp.]|nr:NAD(P)-dependent oxidoreductase [Thermicanus sp.]